jgi:hypothetical protein
MKLGLIFPRGQPFSRDPEFARRLQSAGCASHY